MPSVKLSLFLAMLLVCGGCGDAGSDGSSDGTMTTSDGRVTNPDGSLMAPDGSGPEPPTTANCFESDLDLVLSGERVPGNLELGLASSPETLRNPCGSEPERECFNYANELRAEEGLRPFLWDGDLADMARSHAEDRVQQEYPGTGYYGSSTNGDDYLDDERAEFLGMYLPLYGSGLAKFHRLLAAHTRDPRTTPGTAFKELEGYSAFNDLLYGDNSYFACGIGDTGERFGFYYTMVFAHPASWGCNPVGAGCERDQDCCQGAVCELNSAGNGGCR